IYKPCSTISGDFYWAKQAGRRIIVATADCTGHGVPGALLSMLGIAYLNEICSHSGMDSPLNSGNILNQLRNKIKTALQQKNNITGQKEGMDIALAIIDPDNKQVQFSGAHIPLYLVRENKLIEVKADRMPISLHRREKPFVVHEVPYQSGDMIYLFSDGYADQISETTGTKFMKKNVRKLLEEINQESMNKQKEILERRFEEWKGNFDQVDDLAVFGIRL
ncbi:MAG: SpoIIE family protein phosphatase, partial [bacterium]|nr:SpoIIE family protein phosphatase [bacterium]